MFRLFLFSAGAAPNHPSTLSRWLHLKEASRSVEGAHRVEVQKCTLVHFAGKVILWLTFVSLENLPHEPGKIKGFKFYYKTLKWETLQAIR